MRAIPPRRAPCRFPIIWWILAGYLLLSVGYSVTTPLLETPDEVWHFYFVREVAMRQGLPVQVLPSGGPWAQEGSQPPLYYVLSAVAMAGVDASGYESLIRRNPHAAFEELTPDNRNIYLHGRAEYFPWSGAALAMHLARLVSVACGALAVAATYLLALALFPARRDWAVGGAAFVAFLPQFDFISGAVSNDSLTTALCAVGLLVFVRVWRATDSLSAVVLGVCIGLGALAKSSGMLLYPLAIGLLALDGVRRRDVIRGRQILVLTLVTVAVSGWWFARNQLLYSDWLGIDTHLRIFGARETPLEFVGFMQQWPEIEISFWGLFGWGNVPMPQLLYDAYHALAVLAAFSLLLRIAVKLRDVIPGLRSRLRGRWWALIWLPDAKAEPPAWQPPQAALLLGGWMTLVGFSFYRWMMLVNAPHGRLLFPALPAAAILFFAGIAWFVPARFRLLWSGAWAALFFVVSMYALVGVVAAAFPSPDIVAEQSVPHASAAALFNFDGQVHLGAVETPKSGVHRGEQVTVLLYWNAMNPLDKDYTVTLQLFATGGIRIAQLDTYPMRGMYPTSQWLAGQWLRDNYPLRIAADAPAGKATLIVGMYDHTTGKALQVLNPDGRRAGRATVAELDIQ